MGLVDTGAWICCLGSRNLQTLGYDPESGSVLKAQTAAGVVAVRTVRISSVSLAGKRLEDVEIAVVDALGAGVRFIIGWNVLKRFRLAYDPGTSVLQLDPV